jgi:hypothetical protein
MGDIVVFADSTQVEVGPLIFKVVTDFRLLAQFIELTAR